MKAKKPLPLLQTPLTDMFSRTFESSSSHGTKCARTLSHQPNLGEIITWCNHHQCVPGGCILLWCVWERPGAASREQTTASHSWTRLNHCLQEGQPLYNIICRSSFMPHLWLWQNRVCVFPDGQVSKNRHKLKPNAWRIGPSLGNHCFSQPNPLTPSPPGKTGTYSTLSNN